MFDKLNREIVYKRTNDRSMYETECIVCFVIYVKRTGVFAVTEFLYVFNFFYSG